MNDETTWDVDRWECERCGEQIEEDEETAPYCRDCAADAAAGAYDGRLSWDFRTRTWVAVD